MLSKVKSAVIFTASVIAVLYVAYRIPGLGPIVFQSLPDREVGQCGAHGKRSVLRRDRRPIRAQAGVAGILCQI